jgi:hypothetical protein
LSGRFGQNLHYVVVVPDGHGNTLDAGVTLFEGGPVYRDQWCAKQALMRGSPSDKAEALQACESKPFPSGMHLDYERTSNAVIQMIHVRDNADEDWSSRLPYGHVIDGDQTVYTDFWCAELAASM